MTKGTRGYALVTGASSGIGAAYAHGLARRGYDLILTARREDRLLALASRISAETGRKVETITADLGTSSGSATVEAALRDDERIVLLVNNAGAGAVTPLIATDVDEMADLIGLNVTALTRLTYAVTPRFVRRGNGTIVNIASAVAIGPERLNGVYGGSKAFVLAFSQSLRHELTDKGVRVQVVLPGVTATDIWANSGFGLENLPKEMIMSTDAMVEAALVGLEQGEFMTSPSLPDPELWEAYDAARQALGQQLSHSEPAPRYRAAIAIEA